MWIQRFIDVIDVEDIYEILNTNVNIGWHFNYFGTNTIETRIGQT